NIRLLLHRVREIAGVGHGWKTQLSVGIVSQKTDVRNIAAAFACGKPVEEVTIPLMTEENREMAGTRSQL
ncbi:MAG: hypothetical protein WBL22_10895, partial [Candidatus Sulfotelmatobacter sp.]